MSSNGTVENLLSHKVQTSPETPAPVERADNQKNFGTCQDVLSSLVEQVSWALRLSAVEWPLVFVIGLRSDLESLKRFFRYCAWVDQSSSLTKLLSTTRIERHWNGFRNVSLVVEETSFFWRRTRSL